MGLNIKLPCKAYAYMGGLTPDLDIVITPHRVIVTGYDPETGYCDLTDREGNPFPEIKLTNIGFDLQNN